MQSICIRLLNFIPCRKVKFELLNHRVKITYGLLLVFVALAVFPFKRIDYTLKFSSSKDANNAVSSWKATGFPAKAVSIEELRLCQTGSLFHTQLFPCRDPTCIDCIDNELASVRFEAARNLKKLLAFAPSFNETMFNQFQDFVKENYDPPTHDSEIVLIVTNYKFMYFLMNFIRNPIAELNPKEFMIVCIDEISHTFAKKYLNLNPVPLFWNPPPLVEAHLAVTLQIQMSRFLVHMGYNVLMQDADLVWVRDPRPAMRELARYDGFDIAGMLAPQPPLLGFMNSGFIYLSNRRSELPFLKVFMDTLAGAVPLMMFNHESGTDQTIWNAMLSHAKFRQVHFRLLSPEEFPLCYYGEKKVRDISKVYIMHFVHFHKIKRHRKYGLWFLTPEDNEMYANYSIATYGHVLHKEAE